MTFKTNIGIDPRVFYTQKGGNDSEEGTSLETAKLTIQGSIDAVNALTEPPSAINRAAIIISGSGSFSENISFVNFTSITASGVTNAVATGTNYTLASFSGYSFGLTANSGASEIVFDISNETAVSLVCTEINVTGSSGVAISVSGTTDDTFCRVSQLRLLGDGSIGVNYTSSNGEPELFLLGSVTLEENNVVGYIHNPSASTARSVLDSGSISDIGSPTSTVAIRVIDGHLSAFVNEIIATDAIDLQGGTLSIMSNCITGDITVGVGSTLVCEIAEFTGTLTNNGTIQGRIGTQQFGSGFVTGPGPTVVNNSISTFSGTGGETIQSFDEATLINTGTITTLNIDSPIASTGTSGFSVSDSLGALKGELEYVESTDSVEILTTTAQLTFAQGPGAGLVEILGNDTEFAYETGGTNNAFTIIMSSSPDTNPPFIIDASGTNAATINFFVGNRDPEGNVTGDPGSIYFSRMGVNSGIFQLKAASTGNTGWVASGDVFGPSTSVINSLPTFSDTTGKSLNSIGNATLIDDATDITLTLNSPAVNGDPIIILNNSVGGEELRIEFDDSANDVNITASDDFFITGTGEIDLIAADAMVIRATGSTLALRSNDGITITSDSGAISAVLSASEGLFIVQGTTVPDTNNLLRLLAGGSNGATIDVHVGSRDPNGNISGTGGDIYVRDSGTSSGLFLKQSAASSTADWKDLAAGVQTSETSTTDNAITTWDGTTADTIQQVAGITASGITSPRINFTTGSVTGNTGIEYFDNSSVVQTSFFYDQNLDQTRMVVDSGNGLNFIVLNGPTAITAGADITINANSGANPVTVNSDFTFGATTTDSILTIEVPTASGESAIEFLNNSSNDRLKIGWDENTNIATIETFQNNTELLITSEEQPVEIAIQISDANPILTLSNTANSFNIFSRTNDPQAQVSGTQRDLVIAGSGINNTAIYLQRASASNTTWGQVELLQKQFEFVSTTSTLSLTHNRILVNNTSNITLALPTNANDSRSLGFEQTITKTITNDDVITIDTPGFYGHTGNFVMSQRGNSVTYMQTASDNVILNVNRNVIASMTRPFSAGETTINGLTGADIDLTIWTVNGESYDGLCEPRQASNRFVFPDVENLSAGDQYLITLTVVVRWTNNQEITFSLFVDDDGIDTEFSLLMKAQSTSLDDEVTMHGRALVRTGTNVPLNTDIIASFTLATGSVAIFSGGTFTAEKLEGA